MDHGSTTTAAADGGTAAYTHKQCPHGHCHNHSPEWMVEKNELRQAPFRRLEKIIYCIGGDLPEVHCGKRMKRFMWLHSKQCKRCGRVESWCGLYCAVCACCGYHYDMR